MSENDYNLNNSFDNYQNMMNEPFKRNKTYNVNTEAIPKRYKSPVIYDVGVDNYVFNEIKKAKYQGAFDPGSLGNKNIFLDSNKTNKNSGYNQQKMKKKANYNRVGEGKNLLILKSETQYPINYGYNTLTQDMNNEQRQGKNIYNFNNYYIETKNNNYRNIYARSNENKRNFNSPSNNERKKDYLLQNNNYQNKTINLEKLNKDYDKRFNEQNRTLYEKYSTNTISFNNPLKNYSAPFAPSRNSNFIKKNTMNYVNARKINNISKDENELINDTYNFENDNVFDDYIFNERSIDKNDANKDVKLINFYRRKILNLFFWHINNFYKLYFKSLFKEIMDILRRYTNNQKHNFESKTISNIAEIKKTLKKNSFYYGKNRKYNNILKEVKMKKDINNIQFENENNNNNEIIENEKHLNKESNNIENRDKKLYNKNYSDKKIASDRKPINKKMFIGNNNNDQTKKYIKKKIPQGIYGKKIVHQNFNKIINSNEKNNEGINNNKIQQNNHTKKIENTPIIRKKLKFPKSAFKNNQIYNSGIKIIDNNYLNNNNNNDNDSINSDDLKFENNVDKNQPESDKNFSDNFAIDKNANYIIQSQSDKKNENIDLNIKENEFENSPNKNLENAITIITKVIENKERDDKKNKIAYLIKIINNKINRDKNKNFELINKYFNKLKQFKNEVPEEEKKPQKKFDELNNKGLIKKTKLKRNKKIIKKNSFLSDLEDNKEKIDLSFENNIYKSEDDDKYRNKRNKDKIRIIIKQIKLQNKNIGNNNQYDYYRPKTPTKQNKTNIIENNNKTPKIIIKKTINIIVNKSKDNINESNNKNKKELNEIENDFNLKEKDDKQILNNIEKKDDENDLMNLDIDIKDNNINNINNEIEQEIIEDNVDEDISTKIKLNKNVVEKINNGDFITETEKYEDYQNFIFYLRAQLIYCFLTNKNHEDSLLD